MFRERVRGTGRFCVLVVGGAREVLLVPSCAATDCADAVLRGCGENALEPQVCRPYRATTFKRVVIPAGFVAFCSWMLHPGRWTGEISPHIWVCDGSIGMGELLIPRFCSWCFFDTATLLFWSHVYLFLLVLACAVGTFGFFPRYGASVAIAATFAPLVGVMDAGFASVRSSKLTEGRW